jgi:hypothetical protein
MIFDRIRDMTAFSSKTSTCTAALVSVVFLLQFAVSAASGDDQAPSEPPPAPAAETPSAVGEQELAQRIVASLTEASERLKAGEPDGSTAALQQSALSDIEALLARLRASPRPAPQESDSASQSSSKSGSESQGSGAETSNRNPDAAQSSEDAQGAAVDPQAALQRRRDLVQAVWGHLPPKVQEELRRSFSEHFVPRYDEAIRRYYEALARQPRTDKPK